jgi:hypothetical protein
MMVGWGGRGLYEVCFRVKASAYGSRVFAASDEARTVIQHLNYCIYS